MPDLPTQSLPVTGKGRATRERIIDTAADLIYERGVAAVTLDARPRRDGTSKSQLYHYFADKDDLVHAVIERQRERVLAFHAPKLDSLSSWDDIGRWRDAIVAAQAERQCRSGCPLGSLASALAELDDAARSRLSDAFTSWQQLLADGLARNDQVRSAPGETPTPSASRSAPSPACKEGSSWPNWSATRAPSKSPSTPRSPTSKHSRRSH